MKNFSKKTVLTAAAILLVLITTVGLAGAFFSDYEHAIGKATFSLGGETEITEQVTDTEKKITIHNKGEGDAYVRLSVYGPEEMNISAGEGWIDFGDGFWYFENVLPAGEDTSELIAGIEDVPVTVDLSEMDIIVVHESVPVVYTTEGKPDMIASWKAAWEQ